jgi:hypothetical protein
LFATAGFHGVETAQDIEQRDRVTSGRLPGDDAALG